MKITKEHALFYASKKSKLFLCDVSIHALINSQIELSKNFIDKHNDLTIIGSLYKRCIRNDLDLDAEFRRLLESSTTIRPNRARMCKNILKKLRKNNYLKRM